MKRTFIITLAACAGMISSAMALNIGVSMAAFDDLFQTNLREAMVAAAKEHGVDIQFEDAQMDIGRQLNQIQNFVSQGVDVIILTAVDTASTPSMTNLATGAGIPLVYVNRPPLELEQGKMPEGVYFVGSDNTVSGKLQGEEIARLLNNKGNVVIMMGNLGDMETNQRTEGVEKVAAEHPEMKVIEKQTAKWQRNEAMNLMNNWLVSGVKMDAIATNNDEMAIGAIKALEQAGQDPKPKVIVGIDATADGLMEIKKGTMDATVFQDAKGQGKGGVETAIALSKGEKVEPITWIPFELVTPDNYKEYQ